MSRLPLWWATADQLLKATATPSSKSLMYTKEKKTSSSPIMCNTVCEAHNRMIVSFLQQVQGGARPTTEGSRENIRHNVTGALKQISKQRRRVDVSYDPSMVTALQHGTWMDEERFKNTCIKEKDQREAFTSLFTVHGQRTSC